MSTDRSTIALPVSRTYPLKRAGIVAAVLGLAAVAVGLATRANERSELRKWTDDQAIPTVSVISSTAGSTSTQVDLPGRLVAWNSAPIYARVSGYLKNWYVDIGTHVKAGQLLAEIDTPELDQQFEQAKAKLAQANANEQLAEVTSVRWHNLLATDSVSKQQADEKAGDAEASKAEVLAARADVDRLAALESFKRIVAPFDGIVTDRRTDIGDLINAGNQTGPELFAVADMQRLRLYVEIPQSEAAVIRPDLTAELRVPEYPDRRFKAKLIGSSTAVNATSGAMLVQFETDNADGVLTPGDYADVRLDLPASGKVVSIPASALVFRAAGPQVAVLDKDDHVAMRTIHIAVDLGSTLEVDRGLAAGDRIIDSPPDSLMAGDIVRVAGATDGGKIDASKDVPHAGG